MKRVLIGFCLLSAALVVGLALVPQEADAYPPFLCTNYRNTAVDWGKGPTCEEATQNLHDLLNPVVEAACAQSPFSGTCGSSLVITGACSDYHGGGKVVDGYKTYRCRFYPDQ